MVRVNQQELELFWGAPSRWLGFCFLLSSPPSPGTAGLSLNFLLGPKPSPAYSLEAGRPQAIVSFFAVYCPFSGLSPTQDTVHLAGLDTWPLCHPLEPSPRMRCLPPSWRHRAPPAWYPGFQACVHLLDSLCYAHSPLGIWGQRHLESVAGPTISLLQGPPCWAAKDSACLHPTYNIRANTTTFTLPNCRLGEQLNKHMFWNVNEGMFEKKVYGNSWQNIPFHEGKLLSFLMPDFTF